MATSSKTDDKPKKSKKGLIFIILGAILLAAVAGGVAFYLGKGHAEPAGPKPVEPEKPIFMALEPFTVNLQTPEHDRFLHIGVTLKLADAATQAQITQYLPELRSRILLLLSNHTPDSLLTTENKNTLAKEIKVAANLSFAPSQPQQKVTDVVFTAMVIQ